jgi:hypothetical protein
MSNLLTPVDLQALEAVTGGAATTPRCNSSSNDALLQTLTSISSTIKDLGNASSKSGFSTTEVLMLGLLMNQNRGGQVNVFVRRPYW